MEIITFNLKCSSENEVLGRFTTNCPLGDIKSISGMVQDANINLSDGDEVAKFITIVKSLGYDIEDVTEIDISI